MQFPSGGAARASAIYPRGMNAIKYLWGAGGALNTAGLALRRRPSLRGDDKSWNFDVSSLAGRNTQWEKGKILHSAILFRPSTRARMVAPTAAGDWTKRGVNERAANSLANIAGTAHTHKYWSQTCVRVLCADVCAERMHNKCRRADPCKCALTLYRRVDHLTSSCGAQRTKSTRFPHSSGHLKFMKFCAKTRRGFLVGLLLSERLGTQPTEDKWIYVTMFEFICKISNFT